MLSVKEITLGSKELKKVLHNLHLENMSMSLVKQKRVLELINAKVSVTPTLIKDILEFEKYKEK